MRRGLALRVAASSLTFAVVVGLLVYFVQRRQVGEAVAAHALEQAELFNAEIGRLLGEPASAGVAGFQRQIEDFRRRQPDRRLGRLVLVDVYGDGGRRLGGFVAAGNSLGEAYRLAAAGGLGRPAGDAEWRPLRIAGAPHLEISVPLRSAAGEPAGWSEGIFAVGPEIAAADRRRLLWTVALAVTAVLGTAAMIYPLLMDLVRRLVGLGSDLLQANLEMLQALGGALTLRDTETQAHSARVTLVAVRLAESLGLEPAEIRSLIKGALLHDIGKIAVGDEILLKPGPLTEEEYGVMKVHVRHGAEIVERATWLKSGADVVRYHHEKFNGDGYLEGLAGGEIPRAARIFAIADAFDALSSRRPYKEPMSLEETLDALRRGRGSHFDPELLEVFETIAPALFDRVARQPPEALSGDLQAVVGRYFAVGLEGLAET